MSLVDSELNQFFRFVKLTRFLFRLDFANDLLEQLDRLAAASAFVAFDIYLDAAVGADRDIELALRHIPLSLPMTDLQVDCPFLGCFLLDDDETPRPHFVGNLLVNVLLDHRPAQFLPQGAQAVDIVPMAGDA